MSALETSPDPQRLSVHVVAHTHWDREWYLPFEVFRARLVRLVEGLLNTLEAEPDFTCFTLDGQTVILDDYLEMRSAEADRLRRLVKAGRLLIGPWYVSPDELLVGTESLIRNLARGLRRAAEFGGAMNVGYLPDQFSHSADIPTILRGFGLDTACLWRGVGPEVAGQAFRWQSPSGAEVFAAYLATSYSNAGALFEEPDRAAERLEQAVEALRPYAVAPSFLLMNGDDHRFPRPGVATTLAAAQRALADGADADAPDADAPDADAPAGGRHWRIHLSSLPAYLDELRAELGDRDRELPLAGPELRSGYRAPVLVGTFSARLALKRRNDGLENLLTRTAEPLLTMARLLDAAPYPFRELDYAWTLLLQNHPHDSICGCSLDVVHREMETRFDKAEQVAESLVESALAALDGSLGGGPGVVTVVNPDLARTDGLVEFRLPAGEGAASQGLLDSDGREVTTQAVAAMADDLVFDVTISPAQLRAFLPFISGRQVQGFFINGVDLTRPGPGEARIEAVVGEKPVGDLDWESAKSKLRGLLADRSVTKFHAVVRRSPERRVIFLARAVPGLGWKRYYLSPRAGEAPAGKRSGSAAPPARVAGPRTLENDFYRVSVNPDGTVDLTDRKTGRTQPGLHHLVDGGDRGDLYTYCPPDEDSLIRRPVRRVRTRVTESGPLRATLEVTALYRLPPGLRADRRRRRKPRRTAPLTRVVTEISLVAGEPLVRFRTTFDNRAADHRLQAVFPAAEPFDTHFALSHLSVVKRPAREPVDDPTAWVEPPGGTWPHRGFFGAPGVTIFARGLPEYAVLGAARTGGARAWGGGVPWDVHGQPRGRGVALALTLARSVGWLSREDLTTRPAHAGPGLETPEGQCLGPQALEYAVALPAVLAEAGGTLAAHRRYSGGGLLTLPGTVSADRGLPEGSLPEGGLLELETAGTTKAPAGTTEAPGPEAGLIVASAVKFADRSARPTLVVRLVNYSDGPREAILRPGPGLHLRSPVALDLAEREIGGGSERIVVGPWGAATAGYNPRA